MFPSIQKKTWSLCYSIHVQELATSSYPSIIKILALDLSKVDYKIKQFLLNCFKLQYILVDSKIKLIAFEQPCT